MASGDVSTLGLAPLGPGDLIDRAVRLYRGNFWTFVMIASPPIVVGLLISVGWTFLARSLFTLSSTSDAVDYTFYYLFVWLGAVVIWFIQTVAMLSVMGGASRNFVRHLLFSEPVTFRQTYGNTWGRLGGLLVASSILTIALGTVGLVVFYIGMIAGMIVVGLSMVALQMIPPLAALVSILLGLAVALGTLWLFFLIASRFAYVPQVMLVEGQGVFASIGRSASLASGNVMRLASLFIFSILATYAALALLYIPLALYAWSQGIDVFSVESDLTPAWYEIASQLVWQASLIILTPVWMVGLCLLYVDERVRHEGYDIELMAARRLGDIPAVPHAYVNPLQPALSTSRMGEPPPATRRSNLTTLNLK
ncbi:MAG TPA: hypothetical protein VNA22_03335 [Pyrinomonadaceae bacterium]|nr:hypothetical protein [Pyrinomonadaceae bacterium]